MASSPGSGPPNVPQDPGARRPGSRIRATLRAAAVLLLTLLFALRPIGVWLFTLGSTRHTTRSGARTFRALCRVLCPLLGLRVEVVGSPPAGPAVIAPNHLSYLDVLVIASVADGVFVSRADVRGWTGIGPLSRLGGTIYVDRSRRTDAARAGDAVGAALDDGLRVTVFLEGKATDGTTVLPFRSSLLEPACVRGLPVAAAHLSFRLPDVPGNAGATVPRHVAWTDEAPFGAHVFGLLGLARIDATLRFAPPRRGDDRKALAAALQRDCEALAAAGRTSG